MTDPQPTELSTSVLSQSELLEVRQLVPSWSPPFPSPHPSSLPTP